MRQEPSVSTPRLEGEHAHHEPDQDDHGRQTEEDEALPYLGTKIVRLFPDDSHAEHVPGPGCFYSRRPSVGGSSAGSPLKNVTPTSLRQRDGRPLGPRAGSGRSGSWFFLPATWPSSGTRRRRSRPAAGRAPIGSPRIAPAARPSDRRCKGRYRRRCTRSVIRRLIHLADRVTLECAGSHLTAQRRDTGLPWV